MCPSSINRFGTGCRHAANDATTSRSCETCRASLPELSTPVVKTEAPDFESFAQKISNTIEKKFEEQKLIIDKAVADARATRDQVDLLTSWEEERELDEKVGRLMESFRERGVEVVDPRSDEEMHYPLPP
ncbi:hypothetical protein NMY22_g5423 [Coprinellus aureogranulatus]|nr:hypothetical protein NMY22_g5423 [Coprinellus aureogranulatus]